MSHQILNVPFVKKLNNSPLTKEFLVSETSEDNDDSYENFNDALLSLKVRFKEPLQSYEQRTYKEEKSEIQEFIWI